MLTLADTVKQTLRKRKVRSLTEEYSEPWQGSKIGSLAKAVKGFQQHSFQNSPSQMFIRFLNTPMPEYIVETHCHSLFCSILLRLNDYQHILHQLLQTLGELVLLLQLQENNSMCIQAFSQNCSCCNCFSVQVFIYNGESKQ